VMAVKPTQWSVSAGRVPFIAAKADSGANSSNKAVVSDRRRIIFP